EQRQLAEAVYRTAMAGRALMIQAPTGVGKTIGTLFPLLKALPKRAMDKVLFLVAKTSGRRLALEALKRLGTTDAPAPLRVLELVARETACHFPGRACEAASCPLARGFYDRLGAARARALESAALDRETVRRAALEHDVCPYYLTQELARWCDVIVGDYNYYFGTSALLHALTLQNQWRIGVLVDEAHNLLTRGRDMYSATLDPSALLAAIGSAPAAIKSRLHHVQRGWRSIHRAQEEDYAVHPAIPQAFIGLLQQATTAIADEVAADPAESNELLLRFYFDALHFCRMAEEFGSHSLFDVTQSAEDSTLCIRNVDPGPFLSTRFAASAATVLFSATLAPHEYYRQLLGLPESAAWINVGSPFEAGQLEVRVEPRISTRYRDRLKSLGPIVELMAQQYRRGPGNYLAFFSSFEYLNAVFERFRACMPDVPVWAQVRGMGGGARDEFLARFTPESRGIGFAVLGGAFAEGIDLPGERLIGAFIATLGLPQVNEVNAQIERRLELLFGSGYEYTYLYPGLQKVVQAAGRVIRTPADRGTLYLIDDRYMGAQVRKLLPDWWRVQCN
ncbi:MAG: excision repair protein, partial [Gammaproteobacteria bacterium]|nr:excision repair protein [Gammaproteobacteria bacterium]